MPTCHYHPNVETLVSCGRCGKPLCPDCVGHGATGVRCKECLRQSPQALGLATRDLVARGAVIALTVSVALGVGLGLFGWMGWVSGLVLGFVVGSAAFLGSRRHRDVSIQVIAVAAALAGVVTATLLTGGLFSKAAHLPTLVFLPTCGKVYLEPALTAVIGAILRFRVW